MYAPWEICGLPCEVQAAETNVNASCSCGYIIVPRSSYGKDRVFRLRMVPSWEEKRWKISEEMWS